MQFFFEFGTELRGSLPSSTKTNFPMHFLITLLFKLGYCYIPVSMFQYFTLNSRRYNLFLKITPIVSCFFIRNVILYIDYEITFDYEIDYTFERLIRKSKSSFCERVAKREKCSRTSKTKDE